MSLTAVASHAGPIGSTQSLSFYFLFPPTSSKHSETLEMNFGFASFLREMFLKEHPLE